MPEGHPLVAFVAADTNEARNAQVRLAHRYGNTPLDRAEVEVQPAGRVLLDDERKRVRLYAVAGASRRLIGPAEVALGAVFLERIPGHARQQGNKRALIPRAPCAPTSDFPLCSR